MRFLKETASNVDWPTLPRIHCDPSDVTATSKVFSRMSDPLLLLLSVYYLKDGLEPNKYRSVSDSLP